MPSFDWTARTRQLAKRFSPRDAGTISALRGNVERGPLYTIPAAAGIAACGVSVESGAITLEYRFKEGRRLHVKRDSRIEYRASSTYPFSTREKP